MEASIGMVFQVCFWERRKLQVVAACASKPVVVRYFLLHDFFLICRRARRQRSQSPIIVTVRIDKHFELYTVQVRS